MARGLWGLWSTAVFEQQNQVGPCGGLRRAWDGITARRVDREVREVQEVQEGAGTAEGEAEGRREAPRRAAEGAQQQC